MSKISEHIFGLYSQLVGDEIQPIDENVVDEAMGVINKINVTDDNSLFYLLSASLKLFSTSVVVKIF